MAIDRMYRTGPKRSTRKRTSVNLDFELVREAKEILGTSNTTDTIHKALDEVVRREARRSLASWDLEDLTLEALQEMRRPRKFVHLE